MLSRSLAQLALSLALCLPLAGTAHGHAVVVESEPADGAVLRDGPNRIRVRFNEPVSLIAAQVLDVGGRDISETATATNGTVEIILGQGLANGTYLASYRVVSLDGHPIGGTFVFSVGEASASAPEDPLASDNAWRAAWTAVRALLNACLLGAAGGVVFMLLVARSYQIARNTAVIAMRFAIVGSAASLLSVGVQGGLLTGGAFARIADIDTWRTGLTSPFGKSALIAMAGFTLIVAAVRSTHAAGRATAAVGAALLLCSYAFSGHVVTAGPRWVTAPALLVHTCAIAFWVGSLLPLRAALSENDAAIPVQQFSKIAVPAVGLLIATGLVIAALQVRSFTGLVSTTYGWLLLTKLALVAGMLSLASVNKLRLTPALARGDADAVISLRRTIAAELAVVAAILTITAALGTTPPPRALESGHAHTPEHHSPGEHHDHGVSVKLEGAGFRVGVMFSSAHAGSNSAEVTISRAEGSAPEAKEVTFIAANTTAGVEPIRRAAELVRPGVWGIKNLQLVPAGEWSIRVEALISDFEKPTFEGVVQLR